LDDVFADVWVKDSVVIDNDHGYGLFAVFRLLLAKKYD